MDRERRRYLKLNARVWIYKEEGRGD